MHLLPPADGTCPVCACKHDENCPHNAESLYYQYRFHAIRGRWPTWADAVAHCAVPIREDWERQLRKRGAWTEPKDGDPIGDPPAESIAMAVDIFHNPSLKAKDT